MCFVRLNPRPGEVCGLCRGRGYVELPLGEPGEPRPPARPARIRNFVYGCAAAVADAEAGKS